MTPLALARLLAAAGDAAPGTALATVLIGEIVLDRHPSQMGANVRSTVADALAYGMPLGTQIATDGRAGLALLVPLPPADAAVVLQQSLDRVVVLRFQHADIRVTHAAAVSGLRGGRSMVELSEDLSTCRRAAQHALERGDLRVVATEAGLLAEIHTIDKARTSRSNAFASEQQRIHLAQATAEAADERQLDKAAVQRRPLGLKQIVATYLLTLLVPFAFYLGLAGIGLNTIPLAYPLVVLALLATSGMILIEALNALTPTVPPDLITPEPPASALVAAYLPNEQHTVLETVHNLLAQDYPGGLQVVLAYNTPTPLPIEADLQELAEREHRFAVLRVEHSTSKAANVNAGLQFCTGEFIGIFDADHLPVQGSFGRAWRWLQPHVGNHVLQGHCVVREPAGGRLSRTIAMEFESIYAVAHPGRARVHGFGIFGGSNGYWKAETLHRTRMREEMLTEDIDSTARLLLAGGKIVSDPGLISTELAPGTIRSLWTQRMRWAQGWHQVSRKHLLSLVTNPHFTARQKCGAAWLFGWREIYPWLSLQCLPILAAAVVLAGPNHKSWVLPMFVATTVFTLANGPLQALLAWRVSVPELRMQKRWWLAYLFVAIPYAEMKNLIGRVAQVKEMLGERHWQVTARPVAAPKPVLAGG